MDIFAFLVVVAPTAADNAFSVPTPQFRVRRGPVDVQYDLPPPRTGRSSSSLSSLADPTPQSAGDRSRFPLCLTLPAVVVVVVVIVVFRHSLSVMASTNQSGPSDRTLNSVAG